MRTKPCRKPNASSGGKAAPERPITANGGARVSWWAANGGARVSWCISWWAAEEEGTSPRTSTTRTYYSYVLLVLTTLVRTTQSTLLARLLTAYHILRLTSHWLTAYYLDYLRGRMKSMTRARCCSHTAQGTAHAASNASDLQPARPVSGVSRPGPLHSAPRCPAPTITHTSRTKPAEGSD